MLARHIARRHPDVYNGRLRDKASKIVEESSSCKPTGTSSTTTTTLSSWLVNCPTFEKSLVDFMVATYQPYRLCEDPAFRQMCMSLNKKAPLLSRDKLQTLVKEEYHLCASKIKMILAGKDYAVTTDSWTSSANIGSATCTCHSVDRGTWTMHSMVLGLLEKQGRSTAHDVVRYLEAQLTLFNLSYNQCVAAVTDTESTMVAAGRLIQLSRASASGNTQWMGCMAHQLELVTGIAFDDTPQSAQGTLKAC